VVFKEEHKNKKQREKERACSKRAGGKNGG
jgi:hypothetical protein